jgi:hypothetical protein
MLVALVALALAAPEPQVPSLTEAEEERLAAGEVLLRSWTDGGRVTALGVVRVDAPPRAVWPAVLDLGARVREGGTLAAVREYRRDGPRTWFVQVDLALLGRELRLHHRYHWDTTRQFATYTLDPSRPNDLALADGWYALRHEGDASVLAFQSETEAKAPVPGWVKRWVAREQLEGLLRGIRARAERSAGGG